ncbi:uncharacterized protein LOC110756857 [Prunus avium]|uniref:Uncharacterized protein LOC110756857 n=1 Tax=Prunus avium TaxID=42229 RepID=A0A6P5SDM7_PRUAV|nr:uncharacterized protein LOC110756857 [Prunus avium]
MACHTRSNSFNSRPHPIVQEVDEHLCRLRSSEATSTSSSSISHELSGLQDLHGSVDRLLQLPLTQQALAQETFNQSCEEREEVNLEHSPGQEILDLKEDGEEGNPQGYGKSHGINETISIVSKLRDVEAVTFAVFLVRKKQKYEFSKVDAALKSLIGHKRSKSHPQSHLDNLESCVQDHEEQLECLFRQLIKTRVFLLNILNH